MKFSDFLKEFKVKKHFASTKELFEFFGGEKKLGFSLRHYQTIESGKSVPSEDFLMNVFNKVDHDDQKIAVVSYFESLLGRNSNSKGLLDYLENNLSQAVETAKDNIWDSGRKMMFYSEEQLNFFIQNPDAMRFHKKVVLYDKASIERPRISKEKIQQMADLDLIEIKGSAAYPSRSIYRIPTYENSAPRAVAKGTEYIQKHMDIFLSKEGSPKQKLVHAMQLVKPSVAKRILEQIEALKKWVQSTAESGPTEGTVPIAFIAFAKELEQRELEA